MDELSAEDKRILYVEDDEGLAYLLQKRLARFGFTVDVAYNGSDALAQYKKDIYKAVLLDYTLPDMTGVEVMKDLKTKHDDPPVIMLTAGGNEQLAVEALESGAEDYIIKDVGALYLDLLPHVLAAAIKKRHLRRQNKEQQESLTYYVSELEKQNEKLQQEIHERKLLEADLRDAKNRAEEANMAKSEFLANMSHEIRTPMNVVVGIADILSASQPLTGKQVKYINTLKTSAESLLSLINDLLDISKIESRNLELESIPFSILQIIRETQSMLEPRAREKGLTLTGDLGPEISHHHLGDPTRIRQIVMNLCSNAVKFTESGSVDIKLDIRQNAGNTDTVKIVIADTGIGIGREKIQHIFEKFVQADNSINRKYGGTGLGLAITKFLVEKMGGTITVESQEGQGSFFTVIIPLPRVEQSAENPVHTAQIPAEQPQAQHTVLLVEDYYPNVLVAGTFLEEFGYTYEVASNGEEAFEKIKANKYFLVLMDVQMPVMNGLQTTQMIREYEQENGLPRVPIIGMTANALKGDRERCIASGMDDYISKPFAPSELEDKLKQSRARLSA